jgi:glycosyltransferase involved in cell wall biosynthesis
MKMKLSIISATYNCEYNIRNLIECLKSQTDQDFEWVVCDGGSTDNTIGYITSASLSFVVKIDSRSDFGIYDALNRGIKLADGEYYLTLGSDDLLEPDAICNYKKSIIYSGADIILAGVRIGSKIHFPNINRNRYLHQRTFVAGHSVGTLIRRYIHEEIGYYSSKYPIAADHLFLELALLKGAIFEYSDFIAGKFGDQGVSSKDKIGSLTEAFRIQLSIGGCKFTESIVFIMRLIWNYKTL